jgi:hypothetical protein
MTAIVAQRFDQLNQQLFETYLGLLEPRSKRLLQHLQLAAQLPVQLK